MSYFSGNNSASEQTMFEIEDGPQLMLTVGDSMTDDEKRSLSEQIDKIIEEKTVAMKSLRDQNALKMLYNCIVEVEDLIKSSKWTGAGLAKQALNQLVMKLPFKKQDEFASKSQSLDNLKMFVSTLLSNSKTFMQVAITSKNIRQIIQTSDPEPSGWDIQIDQPDYTFSSRGSNWR